MLPACFGALAVVDPDFVRHPQLLGYHPEQWHERLSIRCKHDAWITHVTELHRKAEPVCWAAMLPDNRQISVVKRVVTNQLFLGVWYRE